MSFSLVYAKHESFMCGEVKFDVIFKCMSSFVAIKFIPALMFDQISGSKKLIERTSTSPTA